MAVHTAENAETKSLGAPDEVRSFPNGRVELVNIGGTMVGRATFQPGWRWSESEKSIVGTESCEAPHLLYHVSGTLTVRMDDGTEITGHAGDVSKIPAGHDAWVVGNEPVVIVDFQGVVDCATGR